MTLEETVLAIRLHKLAVALGVFIVSAPAFSHGHHSHGKPLTEVEQKAANGVFDDANVQNRKLSDWDGVWQSVYPLLQSGKLDPVFGNDSNLLIVFYVQIMPDDFVMQLHRF